MTTPAHRVWQLRHTEYDNSDRSWAQPQDHYPLLHTAIHYSTIPSQPRTPDIRSPDQLLFYLTAIMPPRTYIAFALIFIYLELRNSELRHIT